MLLSGSGVGGEAMLRASAPHLRATALELGGKSAAVIFADSRDMLPEVVDWLMCGIFMTTGQICSATSRVIVERSLHDELVSALVEAIKGVKVCLKYNIDVYS